MLAPVKETRLAHRPAAGDSRPVPHWGVPQVRELAVGARRHGRGAKGDRDALLIATLFDAALRVSEALGLRPRDIIRTEGGYRLQVNGKTGPRPVAVSSSLITQLLAYAYAHGLTPEQYFFPLNRHRAWQIVDRAATSAGLVKPRGVGTVHILRHSGAIERMRVSANPRSVQDQLGHVTAAMTLRYFRTLAREESLQIQETVDLGW